MSRIIVNKLSVLQKILFIKLEKNLKCFIKLDADIKFLNTDVRNYIILYNPLFLIIIPSQDKEPVG